MNMNTGLERTTAPPVKNVAIPMHHPVLAGAGGGFGGQAVVVGAPRPAPPVHARQHPNHPEVAGAAGIFREFASQQREVVQAVSENGLHTRQLFDEIQRLHWQIRLLWFEVRRLQEALGGPRQERGRRRTT